MSDFELIESILLRNLQKIEYELESMQLSDGRRLERVGQRHAYRTALRQLRTAKDYKNV